jgi:hypothetical protein
LRTEISHFLRSRACTRKIHTFMDVTLHNDRTRRVHTCACIASFRAVLINTCVSAKVYSSISCNHILTKKCLSRFIQSENISTITASWFIQEYTIHIIRDKLRFVRYQILGYRSLQFCLNSLVLWRIYEIDQFLRINIQIK